MGTQQPEKVKILNDKLEYMDFLKRLKTAFDEDLGFKPDLLLERMHISYDKSSIIRSKEGDLDALTIQGIKTGIDLIDDISRESILGRRGPGIRYSAFKTSKGQGRYEFGLRIPDSICLKVHDVESVLGVFNLYLKDHRRWMDSNGQPPKLEAGDYWSVISAVRHPILVDQYWMLKFSYEDEINPRPTCLKSLTVASRDEPYDPLLLNFQLFRK